MATNNIDKALFYDVCHSLNEYIVNQMKFDPSKDVRSKKFEPPSELSKKQIKKLEKQIKRLRSSSFEDRFDPQIFSSLLGIDTMKDVLDDTTSKFADMIGSLVNTVECSGIKHNVEVNTRKFYMEIAVIFFIGFLSYKLIMSSFQDSVIKTSLISLIPIWSVGVSPTIVAKLRILLDNPEGVVPQMSTSPFDFVSQVVYLAWGAKMYKGMDWLSGFDKFMKISSTFKRNTEGIKNVFELVATVIEKVGNYIISDLFGFEKFTLMNKGPTEVEDWIDRIEAVSLRQANDDLPVTAENYQVLVSLDSEASKLRREYAVLGKDFSQITSLINVYAKKLKDLISPFNKAAFGKGKQRQEPFTVCLIGKSGVGKSTVTPMIVSDLVLNTITDKNDIDRFRNNYNDFVYYRTAETKFWDGYRSQVATVFDDFIQVVDAPGMSDIESMDVIRATNRAPFLLHMAHLDDKGLTYFSSRMVFLTTNDASFSSNALKEREALIRRMRVIFAVYPSKTHCRCLSTGVEVCVCELDNRRLKTMIEQDNSAWEFHLKDYSNIQSPVTSKVFSYDEFRSYLRKEQTSHYAKESMSLNALQSYIDDRSKASRDVFFDADEFIDPQIQNKTKQSICTRLQIVTNKMKFYKLSQSWLVKWASLEIGMPITSRHVEMANSVLLSSGGLNRIIDAGLDVEEYTSTKYWAMILIEVVMDDDDDLSDVNKDAYAEAQREHAIIDVDKWIKSKLRKSIITQADDACCVHSRLKAGGLSFAKADARLVQVASEVWMADPKVVNNFLLSDCCMLTSLQDDYEESADKAMLSMVELAGAFEIYKESKVSVFFSGAKRVIREVFDALKIAYRTFLLSYPFVVKLLEMLALGLAGYAVGKWICSKPSGDTETQSVGLVGGKKVKFSAPKPTSGPVKPQADFDWFIPSFVYERASRVASKNVYSFYMEGKTLSNTPTGYMLAIKGDLFALPCHYYFHMKKHMSNNDLVKVYTLRDQFERNDRFVRVPVANFLACPPTRAEVANDTWFVRIQGFRPHRDISHHFMQQHELEKEGDKFPSMSYFVRLDDDEFDFKVAHSISQRETIRKAADTYPVFYTNYVVSDNDTQAGDCGMPYYMSSGPSAGKLIGVHAAAFVSYRSKEGRSSLSICSVITSEQVDDAVRRLSVFSLFDDNLPREIGDLRFSQEVIAQGDYQFHQPVKTVWRRSPLYGFDGPSLREPAVLKRTGNKSPMSLAVSRYGGINNCMRADLLKISETQYSFKLRKLMPSFERYILSFEECCAGIPGNPFVNHVERKTSAGYPWTFETAKPGKKSFFGEEGDFTFDSEDCIHLRDVVHECELMIQDGHRPLFVYIDCLKDELRPLSKIADCKTRMINASPLHLTILTKKYFGAFVDFYMSTRIDNGAAIGVNPVSPEWTRLANKVLKYGDNVIAGDFSSFDATQGATALWAVFEVIDRWYNDDFSHIRRALWLEVVNSRHLQGKDILEWDHSLPSGHALTTIINSIYVNLAFRVCWLLGCEKRGLSVNFDDNCSLVAYGDDNIMGVSDECSWFNYPEIQGLMHVIGLDYTDENKSVVLPNFKRIDDVSFLKRSFTRQGFQFIARLDYDVIRQQPYHYRNGPNVIGRVTENCVCALKELSLYDEQTFNTYVDKLNLLCSAEGITLPSLVQSDYLAMLRDDWSYEAEREYLANLDCESEEDDVIPQNSSEDRYSDGWYLPYCQAPSQISQVPTSFTCQMSVKQVNTTLADNNENMGFSSSSNTGSTSMGGGAAAAVAYQAMGGQSNEESNQDSTHFIHDRSAISYQPFDFHNRTTATRGQVESVHQQDSIKNFLRKPLEVKRLTWSTASVALTTVGTVPLPWDGTWIDPTPWKNKLQGFLGLRGDFVVKIRVNADRFSQGLLLCHYMPAAQFSTQDTNGHLYDLCTRTQMQSVVLNANKDTEVEIKIPYVSGADFYNLETGNGPWGILYLTVYSPLLSPNSSVVDISIFASLENVELAIPTYVTVQGSFSEKETKPSHLVRMAAKFSAKLANIPMISGFAASSSWVLDNVAQALHVFGYSKPNLVTTAERLSILANPYHLCADGEDNGVPMGFSIENKVDSLPGFAGSDIDEMAFSYFVSRSAYYSSANWATSDAKDTTVMSLSAAPYNWANNYSIGARTCVTMPPATMLVRMFQYWRGSLVFTLRVVKTEFHTGQLLFTYRPSDTTTGVITPNNGMFCLREVLDTTKTDTFVITVPYMFVTPWLNFNQSMGEIRVTVLNALRCPANVTQSVNVVMEVAAGNDFRVAAPGDSTPVPVYDSTFTPQMDAETEEADKMDSRTLSLTVGGSIEYKDTPVPEQFCMGEKLNSIKQLISRSTRLLGFPNDASVIQGFKLKPFTIGGMSWSGIAWTDSPMCGDWYSAFAACYTIARGSMRFRVNSPSYGRPFRLSIANSLLVSTNPQWATQALGTFSDYNSGNFASQDIVSPMTSITIPQWSRGHSRYCVASFDNVTTAFTYLEPRTMMSVVCPNNTWTKGRTTVFRAAGEDTQLGFFIGVPIMYFQQELGGYGQN